MGSTKENEGGNKISHKGQHLPTKDQTDKIYIQREHMGNQENKEY